jgi:hypothetical protein
LNKLILKGKIRGEVSPGNRASDGETVQSSKMHCDDKRREKIRLSIKG